MYICIRVYMFLCVSAVVLPPKRWTPDLPPDRAPGGARAGAHAPMSSEGSQRGIFFEGGGAMGDHENTLKHNMNAIFYLVLCCIVSYCFEATSCSYSEARFGLLSDC